MEYRFQLGSFPYLSLAEIINVLQSEKLIYQIIDFSLKELHIEIEYVKPEILLKILGGTRSIADLSTDITYKQDIKEYTKREFNKPYVDAKSGLLPTKLAKMMINFSFGDTSVNKIYDPFCGGGTIISEANVMGIKAIGSDIYDSAIMQAKANAKWLKSEYQLPDHMYEFFVNNIKNTDTTVLKAKGIDAIVTEPYLGVAVNKPLRMGKHDMINIQRVNTVITEAIKKASAILDTGKRVVIIIPRFKTVKGITTLEIRDKFNRFSFKKVDLLKGLNIDKSVDLLYFRPNAVVQREIFILEKI